MLPHELLRRARSSGRVALQEGCDPDECYVQCTAVGQ
jgi:hypothetical protein